MLAFVVILQCVVLFTGFHVLFCWVLWLCGFVLYLLCVDVVLCFWCLVNYFVGG